MDFWRPNERRIKMSKINMKCQMKGCENQQEGNWIGPFIQLGKKVCEPCNIEQNRCHWEIGS